MKVEITTNTIFFMFGHIMLSEGGGVPGILGQSSHNKAMLDLVLPRRLGPLNDDITSI